MVPDLDREWALLGPDPEPTGPARRSLFRGGVTSRFATGDIRGNAQLVLDPIAQDVGAIGRFWPGNLRGHVRLVLLFLLLFLLDPATHAH